MGIFTEWIMCLYNKNMYFKTNFLSYLLGHGTKERGQLLLLRRLKPLSRATMKLALALCTLVWPLIPRLDV